VKIAVAELRDVVCGCPKKAVGCIANRAGQHQKKLAAAAGS